MKKSLLSAFLLVGMMLPHSWAQEINKPLSKQDILNMIGKQDIFCKWYQGKTAYYAKEPPHGKSFEDCILVNQYGMVIDIHRLNYDGANANIIRPVHDTPSEAEAKNAAQAKKQVEGTITREQRCDTARKNLNMLQTRKTIYEEDSNGNLVPLDAQAIQERLAQAQHDVETLCTEQ